MSHHLYGDSTVFPYDIDYIHLCRNAIDCAVQLLSAQHAIASAIERADSLNQTRSAEQTRLLAMSEAIEAALNPFLVADTEATSQAAARVLERAKSTVEAELSENERRATDVGAHTRHVVQRASEAAHRALEAFLVQHDVPETELGLTLTCAGEQGTSGEISLRSPFGVSARFSLRLPAEHLWARPRRVVDLIPSGLEIHLPQPSGWISRRVEMAPVKLDRLFIKAVTIAGVEVELFLSKATAGGAGYRVVLDLRGERGILLEPLTDNGVASGDPPLVLDGADGQGMLALCQRVIESLQGLATQRGNMLSAALDEQPLSEFEWPAVVAERLLRCLAPVVNEIARRSGAPGELVLRRDVGDGRREEMYVTKAELWEKLLVLPPERRALFGALGIHAPPLAEVTVEPFATVAEHPSVPPPFPMFSVPMPMPSSHVPARAAAAAAAVAAAATVTAAAPEPVV
jgi:hypothetical protein